MGRIRIELRLASRRISLESSPSALSHRSTHWHHALCLGQRLHAPSRSLQLRRLLHRAILHGRSRSLRQSGLHPLDVHVLGERGAKFAIELLAGLQWLFVDHWRSVGLWIWTCGWLDHSQLEAYLPHCRLYDNLMGHCGAYRRYTDERCLLTARLQIIMYLPDGPHNAKMLTHYEKVVAVWRVSRNRIGLKSNEFKWHQVREALLDPKSWLLWLMGAAIGILNGGVANFASALIKGFGYSALRASLMQTPGGAFEIVGCIMFGYLSRFRGWLCPAIIISCLPGMAGLIGILTIGIEHRLALTAMAWLQNVVGAPIILSWTLPGVHTAGHSKRAATLGIFFAMYCAGNIAGPHLFLDTEVPRYPTAIQGLLGACAAMIVFTAAYWAICFASNKARDRRGERADLVQEGLEGFDDLTDGENHHFRYRL